MDITNKGIYSGKQKQNVMDLFVPGEISGNRRDLHRCVLGTTGKGRELKSLSIWAEKEFGIPLPTKYESDHTLYTHIEACSLLFDDRRNEPNHDSDS